MSNKVSGYLQETYNELVHKVSWPSWTDLQSSSIVVMVASLIIALLIFAMDFGFQQIFQFLYKIF
jgi:preprotein translocase subunit SecE